MKSKLKFRSVPMSADSYCCGEKPWRSSFSLAKSDGKKYRYAIVEAQQVVDDDLFVEGVYISRRKAGII